MCVCLFVSFSRSGASHLSIIETHSRIEYDYERQLDARICEQLDLQAEFLSCFLSIRCVRVRVFSRSYHLAAHKSIRDK